MTLGPHAAFIIGSYALTALVIGGLAAWLVLAGRRHERRLEDLAARGVRRRSLDQGQA
ncbi:MAG: heme exporter protein CcmD [Hyphomicrobiales bacterium]|nr:heme exporter protein CcmD [Hyphomicrobiales bacterium]